MHVWCMQSNGKNSNLVLWKGMNLLYLHFLQSILVFFCNWHCRNTCMSMHYSIWERMNNKVWEASAIQQNKLVEFLSDKFCRSSFYVKEPYKAYCSMSASVFINNVEWEVNFDVKRLIFCNCIAKKFASMGNLKHNHS